MKFWTPYWPFPRVLHLLSFKNNKGKISTQKLPILWLSVFGELNRHLFSRKFDETFVQTAYCNQVKEWRRPTNRAGRLVFIYQSTWNFQKYSKKGCGFQLIILFLLVSVPWTSSEESTPAPTTEPTVPPAVGESTTAVPQQPPPPTTKLESYNFEGPLTEMRGSYTLPQMMN